MTILIQAFIIVMALFVIRLALNSRTSHAGRASKKLALVGLAVAMIVAVVFPNTTNTLAKAVGVGRGADLLLYVTVSTFILYALNNYLQMQDQRDTLHKLARHIAIIEAKNSRRSIK